MTMTTLEDFENLPSPQINHSYFTPLTGSPEASLFLSQLIYWTGKQKNEEGWIYKTQEEWQNEIELTVEQQNGAREKLKQASFLEEKFMGMPRKLYYRLNREYLKQKWHEWLPAHQVKEAITTLDRRYQYLKSQGKNTDLVTSYLTRCRTVLAQARKDIKTARPLAESLIREITVYCSGKTPFIVPGKPGLFIRENPVSLSGVLPSGSLYTEITYRDYEQKENSPYIPHAEDPDFGGGEERREDEQNANLQVDELQQPSPQMQEGGSTPNTQDVALQRVIETNSSFPDQNQNLSTQTDISIRGSYSAAAPQFAPAGEVSKPPQSQETYKHPKAPLPTSQGAKSSRKLNDAETADLIEQLNITGTTSPAQLLAYRLLPWELNAGPNGLDPGFTSWLGSALSKTIPSYRDGCSPMQAKQWAMKSRHDLERLSAVCCRWQEYQESLIKKQQQIQEIQTEEKPQPKYLTQEEITRRCQEFREKKRLQNPVSLDIISSFLAS